MDDKKEKIGFLEAIGALRTAIHGITDEALTTHAEIARWLAHIDIKGKTRVQVCQAAIKKLTTWWVLVPIIPMFIMNIIWYTPTTGSLSPWIATIAMFVMVATMGVMYILSPLAILIAGIRSFSEGKEVDKSVGERVVNSYINVLIIESLFGVLLTYISLGNNLPMIPIFFMSLIAALLFRTKMAASAIPKKVIMFLLVIAVLGSFLSFLWPTTVSKVVAELKIEKKGNESLADHLEYDENHEPLPQRRGTSNQVSSKKSNQSSEASHSSTSSGSDFDYTFTGKPLEITLNPKKFIWIKIPDKNENPARATKYLRICTVEAEDGYAVSWKLPDGSMGGKDTRNARERTKELPQNVIRVGYCGKGKITLSWDS